MRAGFKHYAACALGAVFIGVTLPSILVALRVSGGGNADAGQRLLRLLAIEATATIGCGPGAVVLSLSLFAMLLPGMRTRSLRQATVYGALSGIVVAFLNLPGYLVFFYLEGDAHAAERVGVLFVVAGSSCGMWVAWQAWRACRPNEGFLPRFTLRTVMLVVLLWGSAMLAFQPDPNKDGKAIESELGI